MTRGRTDRHQAWKGLHAMCPHCESRGTLGGSRQITRTYKQFYVHCSNFECGFSWLAEVHVVHSVVPSAMPHPEVHIPTGPTFAQMLKSATVAAATGPPAANDDAPHGMRAAT